MHALPFILAALGLMTIAYRYYSAFIAAKVLSLDDSVKRYNQFAGSLET